jgi:hypothetical protein
MSDILNTLITKAKSISLSLYDYGLLSIALLIGGLVVALKVQGSRLHAAQVALLAARLDAQIVSDDKSISKAMDDYNKAFNDYRRNK